MKLTIVSNYINHHQIPLCKELYRELREDFCFIQTEPMEEERVKMGWGSEISAIPYLKLFYQEDEVCKALIMNSDIVIFGGVEDESYIKPRLDAGKLVIRNSERLYKEGQWKSISPRGRKKKWIDHTQYAEAPVYLLCAGAYVASDFSIVKAYPNKMFTWGYFPEIKKQDLNALFFRKNHIDAKGEKCFHLLWAGRFLDWKHPEYAVRLARDLKKQQISFHLDMIGGGELEEKLKTYVKKHALEDVVSFHGFQSPRTVRNFMEEADIYLFTSDYYEGWGAVLNEAMNSGCAVLAGHGIGAVPSMLRHGENGLVYKNKCYSEFRKYAFTLVKDKALLQKLGTNAYETVAGTWNPEEAAKRLLAFCRGLLDAKLMVEKEGPLSPAPVISPRGGYAYTRR